MVARPCNNNICLPVCLPVSPVFFSGHVGISARHSNHFRVSVNTEAHASVVFYLLYEELLQRRAGIYEHVINLTPRQKLKDFAIEVRESYCICILPL